MPPKLIPLRHQAPLPMDKLLVRETPGDDAVPMDVLFVGGGPAGMAGAIELARLIKKDNDAGGGLGEIEIAVLEKAAEVGQHNLSGAVVNPRAMRELFPELSDKDFPFRRPVGKERVYMLTEDKSIRMPVPPTMKNHGNYIASICEIVRWLGEKAEGLGVNVFTGFPAASLLMDEDRVAGVRTVAVGEKRDGTPGPGYEPPGDLAARVTVLSEGTRGSLVQAWMQQQRIKSPNPQIFALGIKELWETKQPLDRMIHTLGWPLPRSAFGGSFVYPMEDNLVSLGLVVGMDYHEQSLDVHHLLQRLKRHPLLDKLLEGGEMVEWGAKTIPEGGFHSLPERLHGDGVLVVGDAAGFVDVPSLKGIHYAMHSGMLAARTIFDALKKGDTSRAALGSYDAAVRDSYILEDMHETRNVRLAFKKGFVKGGALSGAMIATKGALFGSRIDVEEDAAEPKVLARAEPFVPDNERTFSKVDAVYKSGNQTRDDIPSHLIVAEHASPMAEDFYSSMCPAGVYETTSEGFRVNAPNCIDCKATDVLGPRWTPREGGSGPKYKRM